MQTAAGKRKVQKLYPGNGKREEMAGVCAGTGTVCRKVQERKDCRKFVQETSRESRL